MKKQLEHIKSLLEESFEHPEAIDLDSCISELESLKETAGEKQTMIQDLINSLTHAKNSRQELQKEGTPSSSAAFGQAHRALEQAVASVSFADNDPY
jgi:dipeptidase